MKHSFNILNLIHRVHGTCQQTPLPTLYSLSIQSIVFLALYTRLPTPKATTPAAMPPFMARGAIPPISASEVMLANPCPFVFCPSLIKYPEPANNAPTPTPATKLGTLFRCYHYNDTRKLGNRYASNVNLDK